MPVELSSFDVIVGMVWLSKYHAMTVCDEKIVRIPYGASGYGILAANVLLLNVDRSILYDVSDDVDTSYSSKLGNGLDLV
ncbi:hypothetical protein Tco_0875193 [Tanacetum coccineum]|uniref:Reverse transcriptase domain-containing protein n=1 Tax=Tanacetum coccineum TaxID=301880 RepID=A0ABQ5BRL1_9ASTR